jgi:hypothetical protein
MTKRLSSDDRVALKEHLSVWETIGAILGTILALCLLVALGMGFSV